MPQIADRKSMARYICVDKGATHPALQREELPKHMAIYADYGVTGTDLRQRPELNRLLTDCRAGRVNCIVAQSTTLLPAVQRHATNPARIAEPWYNN